MDFTSKLKGRGSKSYFSMVIYDKVRVKSLLEVMRPSLALVTSDEPGLADSNGQNVNCQL